MSDFLFAFCSLININEAPSLSLKTNIDHTIFSQLFSFTLSHKLSLSDTLQAGRFYMLCVYLIVWTRLKLKVYFACQF